MLLDRDDIITVLKAITKDLEAGVNVEVSEFKRVGMLTKEVTIKHEDFGKIVLTN